MTYKYGTKTVTANELAKLEIIDRLQWWEFDDLDLDEETRSRVVKHIDRVINTLDANGNLRAKIWG